MRALKRKNNDKCLEFSPIKKGSTFGIFQISTAYCLGTLTSSQRSGPICVPIYSLLHFDFQCTLFNCMKLQGKKEVTEA